MAPAAPKPVGKSGLWIGAVLIVVGVIGGIGLLAGGALHIVRGMVDAPAVELGESRSLQLEAGGYELYLFDQAGGTLPATDPEVEVRSDDGAVEVGPGSAELANQDQTFRSIGTFRINRSGTYEVRVGELSGAASSLDVRVGEPFVDLAAGFLPWIAGAFAVGLFGVLGGILLLVITSRRRKRARQAPGGWQPPMSPYPQPAGFPPPDAQGPMPPGPIPQGPIPQGPAPQGPMPQVPGPVPGPIAVPPIGPGAPVSPPERTASPDAAPSDQAPSDQAPSDQAPDRTAPPPSKQSTEGPSVPDAGPRDPFGR